MSGPLLETGITIAAQTLIAGIDALVTKASADEQAEIRRLLDSTRDRLDRLAIGPALDEVTTRHLDRVRREAASRDTDPAPPTDKPTDTP